MHILIGRLSVALAVAFAAIAALRLTTASAAARQPAPGSQSRIALSRVLPSMDGRTVHVKIVDVTYPPGGANTAHRHPCPVVGYVLQGALRMRVNVEPEVIYRAGDTFYEGPGDVHSTSANASATEPARFLAYFTCDRDVAQLSVPEPAQKDPGIRR
jgi:quercetin dioxygenase-like cupin family protein